MKALLFAIGVLGLAAVFSLFEPAPASATPVTSDDVGVTSEKVQEPSGPLSARTRNGNKYQTRYRYRAL
jgi:hypothetical protein